MNAETRRKYFYKNYETLSVDEFISMIRDEREYGIKRVLYFKIIYDKEKSVLEVKSNKKHEIII